MSFPFPWLMTSLIASDSLYMAMATVRQTEGSYGPRHENSEQLEAEYFKAYHTRQSPTALPLSPRISTPNERMASVAWMESRETGDEERDEI